MNEEDLYPILRTLSAHGVAFVVVGNLGAWMHGANVLTRDADVALRSREQNIPR